MRCASALDEDSYLYLPGLLDADRVLALRHDMVEVLAARHWLRNDEYLMDAISIIPPLREGEDQFLEAYDAVQKLEAFHTLAHDPALLDLMRAVVGPTAFPHPLKIARLSFPGNYEVSTPPHQDYPNNQGTEKLLASWIPVGDCSIELGGLAVLRGSHRLRRAAPRSAPGCRATVRPWCHSRCSRSSAG